MACFFVVLIGCATLLKTLIKVARAHFLVNRLFYRIISVQGTASEMIRDYGVSYSHPAFRYLLRTSRRSSVIAVDRLEIPFEFVTDEASSLHSNFLMQYTAREAVLRLSFSVRSRFNGSARLYLGVKPSALASRRAPPQREEEGAVRTGRSPLQHIFQRRVHTVSLIWSVCV